MEGTLVDRLSPANYDAKDSLVEVLLDDEVKLEDIDFLYEQIEGKYLTKDNRVNRTIRNYFEERGGLHNITYDNLYSTINKKVLRAVSYGIGNSKNLTSEVFDNLHGWEQVYLLAGIWVEKANKKDRKKEHYDHRPLPILIGQLMEQGMEKMKQFHDKHYDTEIKLPYKEQILKDLEEGKNQIERYQSKFNTLIYPLHMEANQLKSQIDSLPLLADQINPNYAEVQLKIQNALMQALFPQEMISGYKVTNKSFVHHLPK